MIIDTNIYTAIRRGDTAVTQILTAADVIHVPIPVIAELKKGFSLGSLKDRNDQELSSFLSRDNSIILDCTTETTGHYAVVSAYAQKMGRSLSHNDLWIAALAIQNNLTLLTLNKDFEAILELLPAGSLVL